MRRSRVSGGSLALAAAIVAVVSVVAGSLLLGVPGRAHAEPATSVAVNCSPAEITASATATYTCLVAIPAPDGTNVKFTAVPATSGQVFVDCAPLRDGTASTGVIVASGKTITVLVTVSDSVEQCGTPTNLYGSVQVEVGAPSLAALPAGTVPAATVPFGMGPIAFTVPPAGGLTQGVAATTDVEALIDAQTFAVSSVWLLDVPTQQFWVFIPGAPAFANTLTSLKAADIVVLKSK